MMHVSPEFNGSWHSCDPDFGDTHFAQSNLLPDDMLSFPHELPLPDLDHDPFGEQCQLQEAGLLLPPASFGSSVSRELPTNSTAQPFSSPTLSAHNPLGRLDFENTPAEDRFWKQQMQPHSTKVVESPFSASTVQAAPISAQAAPYQNSYPGCEESSSMSVAEPLSRLYSSSFALDGRISAPQPMLSYESDMLSPEFLGPGLDLHESAHESAHPRMAADGQHRRVWVGDSEAVQLRRAAAAGANLAHRAASTPVLGVDFVSEVRRPSKRSRTAAAPAAVAGVRGRPLEEHEARRILLPVCSRGHSIRIVSGRGEFESPAWKPRPAERNQCLRVRSNELGLAGRVESNSDTPEPRLNRSNNSESLNTVSRQSASGESATGSAVVEEKRMTRASSRSAGPETQAKYRDRLSS